MKIYIKLYSILVQHLGDDILGQQPGKIRAGIPFEVSMPSGSTLGDLVTSLALPDDLVKLSFVNGRQQGLDYRLQPGDQVGMFPPIAGG